MIERATYQACVYIEILNGRLVEASSSLVRIIFSATV